MNNQQHRGTGRRKTAVARVRMLDGSGKISINGRDVEEFFPQHKHRHDVYSPMLDTAGRPRAELFSADALHLNADGYALWRKVIAQYVH